YRAAGFAIRMGQGRRSPRHVRQPYVGDQCPACLLNFRRLIYNETMKYIETERLILRDWKDEDVAPFARMNADPIIMEYFPRRLAEKDTKKLVKHFRDHFKKYGYGPYAVELKKDQSFIGFVGLDKVPFQAKFTPATEIAWRLDYAYWGQGY